MAPLTTRRAVHRMIPVTPEIAERVDRLYGHKVREPYLTDYSSKLEDDLESSILAQLGLGLRTVVDEEGLYILKEN